MSLLYQGSPTPRPRTRLVHGLLGTRPHSRRWAAGERAKLHLYLQLLPIAHITAWAPPPVWSVAALDSHRSVNPTVNCTCEGSRLHAPYENLMPDDLRWSWGGDVSAGERLQIQIIISREVCTETIINQLLADSYQNPISEWQGKTSSGLPLILHYGELYNYFIIYYNVIIIEIKGTINVMRLNHPEIVTPPLPPVHGKIVFHETSPCCQKGWGPLCYTYTYIHSFSDSFPIWAITEYWVGYTL